MAESAKTRLIRDLFIPSRARAWLLHLRRWRLSAILLLQPHRVRIVHGIRHPFNRRRSILVCVDECAWCATLRLQHKAGWRTVVLECAVVNLIQIDAVLAEQIRQVCVLAHLGQHVVIDVAFGV